MQNILRHARALTVFGALLLALPACGGGGGGGGGTSDGGATGGSSNPFSPTDLAGDWTGSLVPNDNAGLPWSDGIDRILSRNFYVRADSLGDFYFCSSGNEDPFDVQAGDSRVSQSAISRSGTFSLTFKKFEKNKDELILVGRLNAARNLVKGTYELRVRTENTVGSEVEAVDAGNFELSLSAGPGHFTAGMIEGQWRGDNYDTEERYSNMQLELDAQGSLISGSIDDGTNTWEFDPAANHNVFGAFSDTAVGLYENVPLMMTAGMQMMVRVAMMDESGEFLTGVLEDHKGRITYFRLMDR